MPFIIVGKLIIKRGRRDEFFELANKTVIAARELDPCLDFSIAPDSINEDRVYVFEKWESAEALRDYRAGSPGEDALELVEAADLNEYEVDV